MLEGRPFVGFLPITDTAAAKTFYCDLLGLRLEHLDGFALVVDAAGTQVRLAVVPEVPEPVGTSAGWLVDDIVSAARQLADAGVELERFPGMDQDADGVWRAPGGDAIAWFRDPDGNRLSLSQPAPPM